MKKILRSRLGIASTICLVISPSGYTEYWVKNVTPIYSGLTSVSVGSFLFDLLLAEELTPATENKVYSFRSREGYLFRYNEGRELWQISFDGGDTYVDFDKKLAATVSPAVLFAILAVAVIALGGVFLFKRK